MVDADVIDFDLSNDSVIFDNIVRETDQPANDSQSEMDSTMENTGDD